MAFPKVSKTKELLDKLKAQLKHLEEQDELKELRIAALELKVAQLESYHTPQNP